MVRVLKTKLEKPASLCTMHYGRTKWGDLKGSLRVTKYLDMTTEGLREMFEGDLAETCNELAPSLREKQFCHMQCTRFSGSFER